MKAIVMAGGEGTRLRPVTGGRPKPMVELLGKPVLAHTVELLKRCGFTDLCFTLRFLPRVIIDYFGDGGAFDVRITHKIEDSPLGTAGGVRACSDFLDDDDFLVISGDAVCDFDLNRCVQFHKAHNADATIVLYRHNEPTPYGLVLTDSEGRITSFSEKPPWENVITSCVNTGIYVFSPRVLSMIPENKPFDFSRDLFPKMLSEGLALYGCGAQGYWCDIGTPEAYRQCCQDILRGRTRLKLQSIERLPGVFSRERIPSGVILAAPVYIGSGCHIEAGASIGPNVVLSDGSAVLRGAEVRDSVINGAVVRERAKVNGSIVGRAASIGRETRLNIGCVIGDEAQIGDGTVVLPNVKIGCRTKVPNGSVVRANMMEEQPLCRPNFLRFGRVTGELRQSLTPETAIAFGGVIGKNSNIAGASESGTAARLLLDALACGVSGAGGTFTELDSRFRSEFSSAIREYKFDGGVFISQDGENLTMHFYESSGAPAGEKLSRKLESADNLRVDALSVRSRTRIAGTDRLYAARLMETASRFGLTTLTHGIEVSGTGAENRLLRGIFEKLNNPETANIIVNVLRGGTAITCRDERNRYIDKRRMEVISALALLKIGVRELTVSKTAPMAIDALAKKYGASIKREDTAIRDGLYSAIAIAAAMERNGVTLSRLNDETPRFAEAHHAVEVSCPKAMAMERLAKSTGFSPMLFGLGLITPNGYAAVRPSRYGSVLDIYSECETMEAAEEMCGDMEKRISAVGD